MKTWINNIRRWLNGATQFTIHYSLFTFHFSLFTSLFSLLLVACSLEENPRDQIPEEEAYKTASSLYLNTVATLYNYIGGHEEGQGLQGTIRGVYDLQTFGSDEAMLPTRGGDWYDGEIWQDMYRHSWSAGHQLPGNAWVYLYKVITLCNRSLEMLDAHSHLLSDSDLKAYQAEVRSLRAIYYWYLLDLFGRVPIITTTDVAMNQVRQSERSEVFAFVVKELQEACPYLSEERSAHQGDYYGRVTLPVNYFVLAKLMLNAEVYTDDNWTDHQWPDGSQMRFTINGKPMNAWQAAIYYCDNIEKLNYYLETSYTANFNDHNDVSNENIWTIVLDKDLYTNEQQNLYRSWHYRHAAAYGFTGENGSCATTRTLEVFGYGTRDQDIRFDLNYWAGQVFDRNDNPVTDRSGKPLEYMPWEVQLDLSYSPYLETAGARMKKYPVDKNAKKDGKLMDNDIVLFRFADVLLMRAEAKFRNDGGGQDDLDAVRYRVRMPLRIISLDVLLDERLLELCWEGWRRQDLIRFGRYESLFEGDIFDDKVDETDGHTIVYPIPAKAIELNPNIKQNPGY